MSLLPFDLDKALAGGRVVTRDGREVKNFAVCLDDHNYPIVGVISGPGGSRWRNWTRNGTGAFSALFEKENPDDLFLAAPDPIVRWVNFYPPHGGPPSADHFASMEEADDNVRRFTTISGRVVRRERLYGRAFKVEIDPGGAR